jgi:transcriptional regulator with XRE-family HTH domain
MKSEILSERLISLRTANGWTQSQLAERLKVSKNYVYMLEKGRLPGKKLVEQVDLLESGKCSTVRGHDVEWIIPGIGKVEPNGYVNVPPALLAEWLSCAIDRDDWKTVAQMSGLLNAVAKENLRSKPVPEKLEEKQEGDKP